MARRRVENVQLPNGVQAVRKPNGKIYYYYAPRRSTKAAGKRVPLGSDPTAPEFWTRLRELTGKVATKGTVAALISEYQKSADWQNLRPASRKDYTFHLNRVIEAAGDRDVAALTRRDLYLWRDSMADRPATANHAMSIMAGLLEFAVRMEYRNDNPAVGIKRLQVDTDGAHPWSDDAYRLVIENAPADLRRMAILGRALGQRGEDLVTLRPAQRHLDGFALRISKLRGKEHFQPLLQKELAEIDAWNVGKLDLYLKSPRNQPYTPKSLNSRWNRWLKSDAAKPLQGMKLTAHGLRATAVCDRRLRGISHQAISAEIRMSLKQVMHYSRFIDQPALARSSRDQRERYDNEFENSVVSIENSR